jgi:hypothetical protein
MAGGGVDREALSAALDGLDAAFERVLEFDCQALTTPSSWRCWSASSGCAGVL